MIPVKKDEDDVKQAVLVTKAISLPNEDDIKEDDRVELITKKCTKCGLDRFLFQFYPNPKAKDGLGSQCKTCIKDKTVHKGRPGFKAVSIKIPLTIYSEIKEGAEEDLRNVGSQIVYLIRKALRS